MAFSLQCAAAPSDRLLEGVGLDQQVGASLPLSARFQDEAGRTVRLADFVGPRPAMLLLAYYTCRNICGSAVGELAARLGDIDLKAGRDFEVVVVSFDASDTPAEASAMKARYTGAQAWHFLTAGQDAVDAITHAVGLRLKRDDTIAAFIHPVAAVIATPRGVISRYILALDPDTTALRYGLIAASDDALGTPIDRLWLLCHSFDPRSGRYTSLVTTMERTFGVACAAALAGLLGGLTRRSRRER
jgi:protein SCO1/2